MKDENITVSYSNNEEELNKESKFGEAYLAHKKQKKLVALLVAGAILVSGSAIGIKMASKKKNIEEPQTTTTMQDNQNEVKLLLSEDFDINNKDAVEKRAKEIFSYMNKESNDSNNKLEITEKDVVNLLYYFNEKYENIDFGNRTNKEAKFKYLQEMGLRIYDLLFQNVVDDVRVMTEEVDGNVTSKVKEDNEIFAYMFIAKGINETNSDKQIAINYAKIVYEQLEDIKNGNVKDFASGADKFYNIVKSIKDNKNMSDESHILLIDDSKTKYPLFASGLSKEQIAYLKEETQNNYLNLVGFKAAKALGISTETIEDCKKSKETEKYVASDAAKANALIGNVVGETKTSVQSKGGEKVRTESKVISEGTTKVETHTFIATPEITTGTYTVVEPGGEVIGEIDYTYVDDNDDWKNYIDEEITTNKDEQPTYIIVDQGGKKLN